MELGITIGYETRFLNQWFVQNKSDCHSIDIFGVSIHPGAIATMSSSQFIEFKNYLILAPHAFGRLAVGGKDAFTDQRITAFRLHELPRPVRHEIQQEDANIRDDQFVYFVEESF